MPDNPFVKKKLVKTDKTSLSLRVPIELHEQIRIDTVTNKKPLCTLMEELIDQNASLQDVQISLASLMNEAAATEAAEPGTEMKILTVAVSLRHYCLVRLEAMRQHTKVRALVNDWLEARYSEPQDAEYEWRDNVEEPDSPEQEVYMSTQD